MPSVLGYPSFVFQNGFSILIMSCPKIMNSRKNEYNMPFSWDFTDSLFHITLDSEVFRQVDIIMKVESVFGSPGKLEIGLEDGFNYFISKSRM